MGQAAIVSGRVQAVSRAVIRISAGLFFVHFGLRERMAAMGAMWQVGGRRRTSTSAIIGFAVCMVSWGGAPTAGWGQATAPAAASNAAASDRAYEVGSIQLEYDFDRTGQPPVGSLMGLKVKLTETPDQTWAASAKDEAGVEKSLGEIGGGMKLRRSALQAIADRVRKHFSDIGMMAVYARVSEDDIRDGWDDRRKGKDKSLHYKIMLGSVREVRTVGLGERFAQGDTVNNSKHEKLREGSPVKGDVRGTDGKLAAGTGNVLQKESVEGYATRLSRQPGRRVDVAVSASDTPGEVTLDYLVSEGKPWYVFAQVSNTGTKNTSEWREHFGVVDNQFTSNDDILSLDYTTANFSDAAESFSLSYDTPILGDRLRLASTVSGSRFTASDLGIAAPAFKGSEYGIDEQLSLNVAQWRDTFVDVYTGLQWQSITGDGDPASAGQEGTAHFWQPYVGARLERSRDTHSWFADARYIHGFTDADAATVGQLGRIDAERQWSVSRLSLAHTFFLEPLLYPTQFQEGKSTLAHEVALSVRGQYAFGQRVIAQQEQTVGGFYTVRGYPESLVASDDAVLGTVEYRFHVPRAMTPWSPKSGEHRRNMFGDNFRGVPDRAYGRPDWDLILRTFVDAAKTMSNSETQKDQTLVGAGVGAELQIKQNMALRLDLGMALNAVENDTDRVSPGDMRLHVSFMLLY